VFNLVKLLHTIQSCLPGFVVSVTVRNYKQTCPHYTLGPKSGCCSSIYLLWNRTQKVQGKIKKSFKKSHGGQNEIKNSTSCAKHGRLTYSDPSLMRARALDSISHDKLFQRLHAYRPTVFVVVSYRGWKTTSVTEHTRQGLDWTVLIDCSRPFYPRDAMLARVIAIATCPSVRPSLRLSVCLSGAGIVSRFLHHLVAPRL